MPAATDKQWVKTYGRLPWWRSPAHFQKLLKRSVETSSAMEEVYASDWSEQDHPREGKGQFAPKGSGSSEKGVGGRFGSVPPGVSTNGQGEEHYTSLHWTRDEAIALVHSILAQHPDWDADQIKREMFRRRGILKSEAARCTHPVFGQGNGNSNNTETQTFADTQIQPELNRVLTPYEKKVDFATLDSETKQLASQGTDRVKKLLIESRDKLLALISSRHKAATLSAKFVLDLELRGLSQLIPTLREVLRSSFRLGQREARKELKKTFAQYADSSTDGGVKPAPSLDDPASIVLLLKDLVQKYPDWTKDQIRIEVKRRLKRSRGPRVRGSTQYASDWSERDHLREENGEFAPKEGGGEVTNGSGSLSNSRQKIDINSVHSYQVKLHPEGLPPEKALEFFERKAVLWGTDIRQPLLGEVKNILFDGIKQGTSLRDLMAQIGEAYLPWLGDPDQMISEQMLTPYRLETLVRTNITEALNEGRKAQFQSAVDDGFVIGLQYSAVLDQRTTEVCRYLDQKVFEADSPELDRLTPPRHYNCRSVVVPVTRMEGPVEYITQSQVAKGIELSGKGFQEGGDIHTLEFNLSQPRDDKGQWTSEGGGGESSNAKSEDAIRAVGSGKDRTFVNADGTPVDEATQARIDALGIPPAWTNVQVSTDPQSPLQAIGHDASGKEQSRYSKQWTTERNAAKHLRVAALAQDGYKTMVAGVSKDLIAGKEEAVVMSLVLSTAMRIGGDSEKAVGATTLEAQHLSVSGDLIQFNFPGKSGKQWEGTVRDGQLARQISARLQGKSETDTVFTTNATKVNQYLKQYGQMSAKDVRTLQGTAVAYKTAKELGMPKDVKEAKAYIKMISTKVAEHLRNTPAVAKSSYIDPAIWVPIQAKFGIQVVK